jgi:hypothetical protein
MDLPNPEEDIEFASDPLQGVERILTAENLLALINPRVWMGHFELWIEDGEVVFRNAMTLPHGERPTMAQAASMIDTAVEAADRFYPAFDFLLNGGKSPEDSMAMCMFDTVGQA